MAMKSMLTASFLVLTCTVTAFGAEEIKVGGGGASIATVFRPLKPHFDDAVGITMVIAQSTPKNGLMDLANGTVDLATGAVPLDAMLKGAEKEGVKIDPATLTATQIAKNRTVIFLHPGNRVNSLSKAQLKGIFTGKISNWNEVGGADTPILVAWGRLTPGQNAQFSKEILDGEPVLKEVIETTDYFNIKETVAATPEAIGIDPFALSLDGTVKAIGTTPELLSDIIVVTKGKPSAKVEKLISYLKGPGNKYIIK
jgi:phosphate transport system substrate-binding protein